MNIYELSIGISVTQKKDYKTYRPYVDQDMHMEYQRNAK
jgi:hypothetical protein